MSVKRIVTAALVAVLSFAQPCMAQESEGLMPDKWPTTVDAVVVDIVKNLSEENKQTIRDTSFKDLIQYHHGWGTGIRNHYGLWRGNKALIESACGGTPCHPDDASMVIIEQVWKALQE